MALLRLRYCFIYALINLSCGLFASSQRYGYSGAPRTSYQHFNDRLTEYGRGALSRERSKAQEATDLVRQQSRDAPEFTRRARSVSQRAPSASPSREDVSEGDEEAENYPMWVTDKIWQSESEWTEMLGTGFILSDVYRVWIAGKPQIVIVGDGVFSPRMGKKPPFEWDNRNSIESDIECVFADGTRMSTVINSLHDKTGKIMSRKGRNDAQHFMEIFCNGAVPPPKPGPTRLESKSTGWSVTLTKPNDMPVETASEEVRTPGQRFSVCMAPLYNVRGLNRWMIEWIEYQRQSGAARLHVYIVDSNVEDTMRVLRYYVKLGFVKLHHWERHNPKFKTWVPTYTGKYESGKMMAWNDCYLRERGLVDYMEVADIDEIFYSPVDQGNYTFQTALDWCEDHYQKSNIKACQVSSVTMVSAYKPVNTYTLSGKLLVEEYNAHEAKPLCPWNCGKYHKGRQKYIVRTRELSDNPLILWTHAVGGEDYTYADKISVQFPYDILHVLHYNAWWYVYFNSLPTLPLLPMDFHKPIVNRMRKAILEDDFIREEYSNKDLHGLQFLQEVKNYTGDVILRNLITDGSVQYTPDQRLIH